MNNHVLAHLCTIKNAFIFFFVLALSLLINGAIPFIYVPTLGQSVWTLGFAKSFLNDSLFTIYAHNIGAPEPAAISFGLSGAWLSALFMKLGLLAPDAYSAMIATWLTLAFCSAYGIARLFSVNKTLSIFSAFFWLTMPIIWAHAGYSMLSTGIALIPFYFLSSLYIFYFGINNITNIGFKKKFLLFLLQLISCILSVFMDGYSFMMFAAGATIFGAMQFLHANKERKKCLALFSCPIHFAGLGIAYVLYALYIGKPEFEAAPIDFFRGWGVDITFLLIPSQGMHWLPDLLGLSVPRSGSRFFGDASVWMTSFSIPVILGAIWASYNISRKQGIVKGLILVTLFGFYMSLGPSIKFNSTKPDRAKHEQMMDEQYAVAPTGSAILSKNLPGFKNMRASYRWVALGVFGAWALLTLAMSEKNKRRTIAVASIIICLVTIFNLPNLSKKLKNNLAYRSMFFGIESDLINNLKKNINQKERVAFLPWRNDFLANYVASGLNIISYNIGGDKNLLEAKRHWPITMSQFPMAKIDSNFANRILLMLVRNEADAIILTYIDMLQAAHTWPYPIELKDQLDPVITQLKNSNFVEITKDNFFSVVRLKPKFKQLTKKCEFSTLLIKDTSLIREHSELKMK
ncbi:hypothetical protein [Acinetobacter sp.]|uniref:hypothetical protein n=1 Tax=Acinetobacter sp. TaxID=472 RepID=UPI003CFFF0BC